ncbi:MAG: hypothetical protein ABF425_04485, partial [Liquorilactobacillus sp.]
FIMFTYLVKNSKNMVILSPATCSISILMLWIVGKSQINDYFLNQDHYSPRKIFLEYAIDIAKRHFPFGLGFGSYGSDAASKFYSSVYVFYGFGNLYALGPQGGALNDNYFASVLGQFGWLGLFILVGIFILMLIKCLSFSNDGNVKALCLSLILVFVIAGFGSGTVRSAVGMLLFGLLGILFASQEQH